MTYSPSKIISKSSGSAYGSSNGCTAHSIGNFCIFGYKRWQLESNSAFRCAQTTLARLTEFSFAPVSGMVNVPIPFQRTPNPLFFTMTFTLNTSSLLFFKSSGNPPVRANSSAFSRSSFFFFSSSVGSGANSFRNAPPFFPIWHVFISPLFVR